MKSRCLAFKILYRFLFVLLILSQSYMSHAEASFSNSVDHSVWDGLLKKNVEPLNGGQATVVNYAGFQKQRTELKSYLNSLSGLSPEAFDGLDKNTQLAFLINAYNAWTVEFILTKYPDLKSIKELGSLFRSPWKKAFIPLLGKTRSLDDIEHNLIRGSGRYNEARIHFAVNCASIGCPALRTEAYQNEQLEAQLEEQTKLFLSDRTRNRSTENELEVSSIFKWYREDFEKGWSGVDSLEGFFVRYADSLGLSEVQISQLKAGDLDIDFLDYDWQLNKK